MKNILIKAIPYVIACMLLGIGASYDYSINVQFAHALAGVDFVFERFAIFPLIVLLIAGFHLYHLETNRPLFLIFAMGASIYAGFDAMGYWLSGTWMIVAALALAILFVFVVRVIVQKIPVSKRRQVGYWLMYFTMVLLISILVTTILKQLWGRVRFREGNGMQDFTPWYLPQGINGHKSFPSGHTTTWTSILCLFHLHPNRRLSWFQTLIIIGLVILMPLTRISCGAHYLSDVSAGFIITYTIYLWMTSIYKKRRIL
jgi:membrane-associated phospholipid phosphatase